MTRTTARAEIQWLEPRHLMDAGALDTTFSTDGRLIRDLFNNPNSGQDVAVLANGKLLVAGTAVAENSDDAVTVDIVLLRYNTDGTLDSTFGVGGAEGDGIAVQDFDGFNEIVTCMLLQPDGKILVGGQTTTMLTTRAFIARFNKDGTLDQNFASNGFSLPNFGTLGSIINDIALQSDKSIVAVGTVPAATGDNDRIGIARLNQFGSPDLEFGSSGTQVYQAGHRIDSGNAIVVQNDDKIVIAGRGDGIDLNKSDYDAIVWRFNADGSFDDTFFDDGKAIVGASNADEQINDVVILPSGLIAVAGVAAGHAAIWAFDPEGGESGTIAGNSFPGGEVNRYDALAVRSDGQVIAVGTDISNSSVRIRVNRVIVSSSVISDVLGFVDNTVTFGATSSSFASAVAIHRNGNVVIVGSDDPTSTTVSTADLGIMQIQGNFDGAQSISGRVFADKNGNGKRNKADVGIGGVRVYLDDDLDNRFDAEDEISVLSFPNGQYTLPDLNPNSYRVREIVPRRFHRTLPIDPSFHAVNLTFGKNAKGIDFGNESRGVMTGIVFEDADFSFTHDDDEPGLANFTVFIDANEDGILDDDEISVKTNANGKWKFTGLNFGTYIVRVKLKSGYVATLGPDRQVDLEPGGLSRGTLMGLNHNA